MYAVANDTPSLLWMASGPEEITFINQTLANFLGTEHLSLSKDWPSYLHPADAERARAKFVECLEARSEYRDEFRIRRFDGKYRWVVDEARPVVPLTSSAVDTISPETDSPVDSRRMSMARASIKRVSRSRVECDCSRAIWAVRRATKSAPTAN